MKSKLVLSNYLRTKNPKRASAADIFVLCSKGHAVEQDGRPPSLEDGDEEGLES